MKVSPGELATTSPASPRSVAARLSRHWLLLVLLVPAIVLRAITMFGYRWALWFNDSYQYIQFTSGTFRPDPTRPSGYSVYLRLLRPLHSFAVVTISQHLMGLAIGIMIYALLVHRFKVPLWIAALAAVPALYDAYQIELEHLLMADTLFAILVTAAITVAMWRPKPSMKRMAVAGLLLGLAAVTRSIGLPLLVILVVYLLIRRAGWRAVTAAVVACAVPVGGYVLWFYGRYQQVAMSDSTGIFLYSRVMAFADCSKFSLPAGEKALCTAVPPGHRMTSQDFIWTMDAPLRRFPPPEFGPLTNSLAKAFAMRAIEAQPLDYARVVWDDTWRSFAWKRTVFPDPITYGEYVFASANGGPARGLITGHGFRRRFVMAYEHHNQVTGVHEAYASIMRSYQSYVFLPGTMLGVLLVIGLGGMVIAWRRIGGEILLPWAVAVAMIVLPAATVTFDYRYLLPAVPFACLAAAMVFGAGNPAGDWLAARRKRRRSAAGPAPDAPEPAPAPRTVVQAHPGGGAAAGAGGTGPVPRPVPRPAPREAARD